MATIMGTAGNNYLTAHGIVGLDVVHGLDGNDNILANGFRSTVDAVLGHTVYGGNGNDYIKGTGALYGDAGNDTIFLNSHIRFSDNIFADGGAGNDSIVGGLFADKISGGEGNDVINAGNGDNNVNGGKGDDFITSGAHRDEIYAGEGNDSINSGQGNDELYAGAGNDSVNGDDGNDVIYGDVGDDKIEGGAGNDFVNAGAGNDFINGDKGNDTIDGTSGNDSILGGEGNDSLRGGAGNDTIHLGTGLDRVDDAAGNDMFYFGGSDGSRDVITYDVRTWGGSGHFGNDKIFGFATGEDKIAFIGNNVLTTKNIVTAGLSQVGSDAVITTQTGVITLVGVTKDALLSSDSFIF